MLRGWDRYTIGIVRALMRRQVDVTLLCHAWAPVHERHRAVLDCEVLPVGGRAGIWWEQTALPLALRRAGFDLYHAPAEHGVPRLRPCPAVLTLHSATAHSYADMIARGLLPGTLRDYLGHDVDPGRSTFANRYWTMQVMSANHVIAPSAFAAEEIVRLVGVPAARVSAIPLAADEIFRGPPRDAATLDRTIASHGLRRPFLLYVGGYERHKNVGGLLAAFALLTARKPELALVLIGSGPAPDALIAEARGHGLRPGDNVHFRSGVVEDLPALYEAAELFVSLSWRESFGLPPLEAMMRGTAPVVSAWGAAPEVVGDAGRLVDPRDHAAFVDAVLRLLADPGRSDRARAAAKRFSWDAAAEATLAIYERLRQR